MDTKFKKYGRPSRARCPHGKKNTYYCKACPGGGGGICEHGVNKYYCKQCPGNGICKHRIHRYRCEECFIKGNCRHRKAKSRCKKCRAQYTCEHGNIKNFCKECPRKPRRDKYHCEKYKIAYKSPENTLVIDVSDSLHEYIIDISEAETATLQTINVKNNKEELSETEPYKPEPCKLILCEHELDKN